MKKINSNELYAYKKVQSVAKTVLSEISDYIKVGVSEQEIAQTCQDLMISKGIQKFWYHNVAALVLLGNRTKLSISGKNYKPSMLLVSERDLVTIDLSPEINQYWGDCARSFAVIEGKVCTRNIFDKELSEGIEFEQKLHQKLMQIATPNISFHEIYSYFNSIIRENGYINLDFRQNLGHSIEKNINDRKYIEDNCTTKLSEVSLFTFEPHICKSDKELGFKHENIYYFEGNILKEL